MLYLDDLLTELKRQYLLYGVSINGREVIKMQRRLGYENISSFLRELHLYGEWCLDEGIAYFIINDEIFDD